MNKNKKTNLAPPRQTSVAKTSIVMDNYDDLDDLEDYVNGNSGYKAKPKKSNAQKSSGGSKIIQQ